MHLDKVYAMCMDPKQTILKEMLATNAEILN